jgi:hypothetical protein
MTGLLGNGIILAGKKLMPAALLIAVPVLGVALLAPAGLAELTSGAAGAYEPSHLLDSQAYAALQKARLAPPGKKTPSPNANPNRRDFEVQLEEWVNTWGPITPSPPHP